MLAAPPSGDTVDFSPRARALLAAQSSPEGSLADGFIDEDIAKVNFVANLRVLETADEMLDTLIHAAKPAR